uniref:Uncharacterized protein n=1 Tax=Graphocephala atropunctata TaxID=36148 RepID=A0A1B6MTT3_9HEMI
MYLGMSYRVVAFISPIVTSTDDEVKVWNPVKRGCYFENERYLRYFRIYTQRNCERECDSNNTFKHCGCVLISHPRSLSMPVCGNKKTQCVDQTQRDIIRQEIRYGSSYACRCLPSCNDIDFETEAHWRPWQFKVNSTFASVPATVDLNSTSVSLIAVGAKKKYLNKTKRTALIGSAAYVANIGGILSLFLGISFLSLFEVVYFITLRILINLWNMKKRDRRIHQQHFWVNSDFKKQPFIP